MLNRTAGALGRNAAAPLSPSFMKLEPEQRVRLIKSSQKVGRVLGATPVIDVVSPTAITFTPTTTPKTAHTPLGNVRSLFALHSPVAFINTAVSKASAHEDALKSPVMHCSINISQEASGRGDPPASAAKHGRNGLRRKNIPAALPLPQGQRTEALPLSPFRYGMLKSIHTPALSPVSPISPFSPITVEKVEQNKLEKLEKLEKLAQCANVGVPQELIYPSFGQVEEKAEKITSFLDLYRMRAQDDGELFKTRRVVELEEEMISGMMNPRGVGNANRASRRMSRGMSTQKRRSRSVGAADFYSFADALELQSPRLSYKPSTRLSRTLNSPTYLAPPPTAASVCTSPHPYAAPVSPSIYSQESIESEGDVAVIIPSATPPVSPGMQRKQSISQAKQSIIGADAKLMEEFRTGFGTRPLDFTLPPLFPAPTGPLPSPPVSASLADVRSPRVPYWVKSSFRPRNAVQALQYVDPEPRLQPKRNSRAGRLATPRTLRFERRMGWGGQWNQGTMAGMIDSLKEL